MEIYLVILAGGGDIQVKGVDKETIDWIESRQPEMSNYSAVDKACPESIRKRAYKEYLESTWLGDEKKSFENFWPTVTSGSCHNDRALFAPSIEVNGMRLDFDDVADVTNWCVDNNIKVADTWEGCIY